MSETYIQHKVNKIMNFDYSNCKTVKDSIVVLEMMMNKFLMSSESFLTLNNASSFPQGNDYIEAVKDH